MAYICVHPRFLVSERKKERKSFESERVVVVFWVFCVAGVGRVTKNETTSLLSRSSILPSFDEGEGVVYVVCVEKEGKKERKTTFIISFFFFFLLSSFSFLYSACPRKRAFLSPGMCLSRMGRTC